MTLRVPNGLMMSQGRSYVMHDQRNAIRPTTIRNKFIAAGNRVDSRSDGVDSAEVETCEVSPEGREVRRRQDPTMPNSAEVDAHNLTHLPYRCWCKHCVRGKAKEMAHMMNKRDPGEVPEVHFDFASQESRSQAVT